MAHDLMLDDAGHACLMYVKEVPWHHLGTRLDTPPTAEEAICRANLDWTVVKKRIQADLAPGWTRFIPETYALTPDDGWVKRMQPVFGIVGERYQVLQNRDAFAFFDPLVRNGHAVYDTAGALGDGERVWVLARLTGEFEVGRADSIRKYLLLSNSHDGHGAVQIKMTPVRVVCQNTLSQALSDGGAIRVAHAGNIRERLKAARRVLEWQRIMYATLAERYRAMAGKPMGKESLEEYLHAVFPDPPPADTPDQEPEQQAVRRRLDRTRRFCTRLFHRESDTHRFGHAGTLWTAYNSVTEFVDHVTPARLGAPIRRLDSMWFGKGYTLKARAYRTAVDLLQRA